MADQTVPGRCPNTPACEHPAMIHDVSGDPEDPKPMCCADGCTCGQPGSAQAQLAELRAKLAAEPTRDGHPADLAQTPETVAPVAPGVTNAPTPASPDAGNATDDLRAQAETMPNFWWSPTNHLYRGGDKRPCADAVRLVPESAEHQRKADMVDDFCTERAEYITAINNCPPGNTDDYHRWSGHAEARRQLSERLMGVGLPPSKPLPATDSSAHVVRTIAAMFAATNRQHMAEWLTDTADAIEREVPWPKLKPKPVETPAEPGTDPHGRPLGGPLERDARLLAANVALDLTDGSVDNGTRGYWADRVDDAYGQLAKFGRDDDVPEACRG